MAGRVEGKVAFITGAARGQGRAHAVRLAPKGADIIAVDICKKIDTVDLIAASTPEDLAETADLVKGHNRRIYTAEVDVRDYDALKAAVDAGVEQMGRLDIIVANAGIGNGGQTLDKTSEVDWTAMIDINLGGVWKTVKAGVPHILEGGRGGSIILTSSVGGLKAYPHTGHYVAAKHGVVGLMRTFAVELGAQNIRVNSVHPTNVNTPLFMNDGTMRLFRPDLENPGPEDMKVVGQLMHTLPIGWVEPEDIANAVLFLASDEARYVTGVTLPVDGGSCLNRPTHVTVAELSLPQGWDDITPDWMTAALSRHHPDAVVDGGERGAPRRRHQQAGAVGADVFGGFGPGDGVRQGRRPRPRRTRRADQRAVSRTATVHLGRRAAARPPDRLHGAHRRGSLGLPDDHGGRRRPGRRPARLHPADVDRAGGQRGARARAHAQPVLG